MPRKINIILKHIGISNCSKLQEKILTATKGIKNIIIWGNKGNYGRYYYNYVR